jgi:hypothetical protein
MTHRCNVKYGKCAFPCATDNDCIRGATCLMEPAMLGVCIAAPLSP